MANIEPKTWSKLLAKTWTKETWTNSLSTLGFIWPNSLNGRTLLHATRSEDLANTLPIKQAHGMGAFA